MGMRHYKIRISVEQCDGTKDGHVEIGFGFAPVADLGDMNDTLEFVNKLQEAGEDLSRELHERLAG